MTTVHQVSPEQAEATLAAIKEQFKTYLEPLVLPAHDADEFGPAEPEVTLGPVCDPPVLVQDWDGKGNWAVVWEDGPNDWAMRIHDGGPSEEERVLLADAWDEFAVPADKRVQPTGPVPAVIPAGVQVEPFFSYVAVIYPA